MTEEKKTTSRKSDEQPGMWMSLIFQSIRSFVDGTLESVHQTIHRFTRNLMRRTAAVFFCFVGFVFIFVSFAKLLNAVYPIPGIGEATVGIFMLLLASVLYAFSREE